MDPLADLYKRTEKLRTQIHAETDHALRKAMVRTHASLMKEIRKASHHSSPAKLFLGLTFALVLIVAGAVYGVAVLQDAYGIQGTVTSVLLVIGAVIVLTAMAFLVMKIITPEMYKDLVQIGSNVLRGILPSGSVVKADGSVSNPSVFPKSSDSSSALPAPHISFEEDKGEQSHSESK
jgi:hypothetical protein